jgi:glucose-6-phosphate 1-dehydrogenase
VVRLRRAPRIFPTRAGAPNHFRFRISPDTTIALGTTVMDEQDSMIGEQIELLACRRPGPAEMDAYERVLGDAMEGDRTLFARGDYVEEAWRIVDPVLKQDTPLYGYEPGTWGPKEVDERVVPQGGWENPVVAA